MNHTAKTNFKGNIRKEVAKQAARLRNTSLTAAPTSVTTDAPSIAITPQISGKIKELAAEMRITMPRSIRTRTRPATNEVQPIISAPRASTSSAFGLTYPALPAFPNFVDLLSHDNALFLERTFTHLLHRQPDDEGQNYYLNLLSEGQAQIAVIQKIWNSAERKQLGTQLAGIGKARRLARAFNFPVIGAYIRRAVEKPLRVTKRAHCSATTLLQYDGENFVRSTYRAILNREPDHAGLCYYLNRLKGGVPKIRLIRDLRYSAEGRAYNSALSDFAVPAFLEKSSSIPLVGWIFASIEHFQQKRTIERVNRIVASSNIVSLNAHISDADRSLHRLALAIETRDTRNAHQIQMLTELTDALDQDLNVLSESVSRVAAESRFTPYADRIAKLESRIEELLMHDEMHHDAKITAELLDTKASTEDLAELGRGLEGLEDAISQTFERVEFALEQRASKLEVQIEELLMREAELRDARITAEPLNTKASIEDLAKFGHRLAEVEDALSQTFGRMEFALEQRASKHDLALHATHNLSLLSTKCDQDTLIELRHEIAQLREVTDSAIRAHQHGEDEYHATNNKLDEIAAAQLIDRQSAAESDAAVAQLRQDFHSALNTQRQTTDETRNDVLSMQHHLRLLLRETRARMPEPLSPTQQAAIGALGDRYFDSLYAHFEARFRGDKATIKRRQEAYLPRIAAAVQDTNCLQVLDLGCGRCEWLELMQTAGYGAVGVDINTGFVAPNNTGFAIVESDAIEYLRTCAAESVAAVTSFHMIEHIPAESRLELIDEALRVLKPGGIVVFETPNPENLIVGACNFYLDPTHKNPIPPQLLRFLAEERGFVDVEIVRLHPNPTLQAQLAPISEQLANLLAGPQDYAIVARKA